MKNKRFKKVYRKSASKLHRSIGDILRALPALAGYKIYQEYPVEMINNSWKSGREHYDWVILDLKVVIECHGRQHYEPVAFVKEDAEETIDKFRAQKVRDSNKKQVAIDAGFGYIAIPYNQKITGEQLLNLINEEIKNRPEAIEIESSKVQNIDWKSRYAQAKEKFEANGIAEARREKAREYRKEKYKELKEYFRRKRNG